MKSRDAQDIEVFRALFWNDVGKETVRSREEYLQLFPNLASEIDAEIQNLQTVNTAPESAVDADRGDFRNPGSEADLEGRIGRFRLIKELGRGAQGTVYLAWDEELSRKVALKILSFGHLLSPRTRLRFKAEAERGGKLNHPGIARIYDWGEDRGTPFIAMEFLEGRTLAEYIRESSGTDGRRDHSSEIFFDLHRPEEVDESTSGPDSTSSSSREAIHEVLGLIESAARALHAAHEVGLVHRDIKPGNMMVQLNEDDASAPPRIIIFDFGLAADDESDGPMITQTGDFMGTPAYMAPEQLTAQRIKVDRRSDVYSLGVTLFECLTLKRPFESPSKERLYRDILTKEAPSVRALNRSVSRDLATVVACALEKNADRRYQTALDFAEDLRRVRENEPTAARPIGPLGKSMRWAQRNPVVAVSTFAVMSCLIAAAAIFYVKGQEAEDATQQAERARRYAESESEQRAVALAEAQRNLFEAYRLAESASDSSARRSLFAAKAHGLQPDPGLLGEVIQGLGRGACHRIWSTHPAELSLGTGTVSSDGKLLAYGGDWGIAIIGLQSRRELMRLGREPRDRSRWHFYELLQFISGDEQLVAVKDGVAEVWDLKAQAVKRLSLVIEGTYDITASASGRGFGLAGVGGSLVVFYDIRTGREEFRIDLEGEGMNDLAVSPDGKVVVLGTESGAVHAWQLDGPSLLWERGMAHKGRVDARSSEVNAVSFSPDGAWVATGGDDQVVRIWRTSDGQEVLEPRSFPGWVAAIDFGPESKRLYVLWVQQTSDSSSPKDQAFGVATWDLRTQEVTANRTISGEASWPFNFRVLPFDEILVQHDEGVLILGSESLETRFEFRGPTSSPEDVVIDSATGDVLVVDDRERVTRLDAATGKTKSVLQLQCGWNNKVSRESGLRATFSDRSAALTLRRGSESRVYSLTSDKPILADESSVRVLGIDGTGSHIAVWRFEDHDLEIWRRGEAKPIWSARMVISSLAKRLSSWPIGSFTLRPLEEKLQSRWRDKVSSESSERHGNLDAFECRSQRWLINFDKLDSGIFVVTWKDLPEEKVTHKFIVEAEVASVAIAEFDGEGRLAIGTGDGEIMVFNQFGALLAEFEGHHGRILQVVFSSDATRIVGRGIDGALECWQVPLAGRVGSRSLSIGPRGQIAYRRRDGTIVVVNSTTGEELARLASAGTEDADIDFSRQGDTLASRVDDRTLSVWRVTGDAGGPIMEVDPTAERWYVEGFSRDGDHVVIKNWTDDSKEAWNSWNIERGVPVDGPLRIPESAPVFNEIVLDFVVPSAGDNPRLDHVIPEFLEAHTGPGGSVTISVNEELVAVSSDGSSFFEVFDLESGALVASIPSLDPRLLAFSADNRLVAAVQEWGVEIWDLKVARRIALLGFGEAYDDISLEDLRFNKDGSQLLCVLDGTLKVWDLTPLSMAPEDVLEYVQDNLQLELHGFRVAPKPSFQFKKP